MINDPDLRDFLGQPDAWLIIEALEDIATDAEHAFVKGFLTGAQYGHVIRAKREFRALAPQRDAPTCERQAAREGKRYES